MPSSAASYYRKLVPPEHWESVLASGFSAASHGYLYPPSVARSVIRLHPPPLSDERSHQVHQVLSERNTAPLIMSLMSLTRPHVPIVTSTIPSYPGCGNWPLLLALLLLASLWFVPYVHSRPFFVAVVDRFSSHYSGILDRRHLPKQLHFVFIYRHS